MTVRNQPGRLTVAAALAAALAASLAVPLARGETSAPPPTGHWREASLDQYRRHLQELSTLVGVCAKGRDMTTCDPALVGEDDRVPLSSADAERRLVRFGWLRVLLSKARDKDEVEEKPAAQQKGAGQGKDAAQTKAPEGSAAPEDQKPAEPTRPPRRSTTQLLEDAEARLAQDLAQSSAAEAVPADHTQQRQTLKQILAGKDFRNLEAPSARDSALEKLGNWLNRLMNSAARLQARSVWVGRLIVWGFILAVCVGLIWGLLQLERRWRIRLVPETPGPAAGAASARDWQLWLNDARACAAQGQFREAIHFVYWASISRLESKRLWPADRARTPREYLALVDREDPRRPGLASLTGSFERTWYGGRAAAEGDYRSAEELAAALIAGSGQAEGGGR